VFSTSDGVKAADGGAGSNYTVSLDIGGLSALAGSSIDKDNDYFGIYDHSATAHKKVKADEAMVFFVAPGIITMYGASVAPTGWLLCDGSAVSRTTYSRLFSVVSTTYGAGDGSTTFNVPDLRGRFPQGSDGTDALGATGGSKTPTITSTDSGHTHTVTDPGHQHSVTVNVTNNVARDVGGQPTAGAQAAGGTAASNTTGITVDSGNANISSSTADGRPPFLAVNFIIKT
jgi:microcystin-dependent protein